MFTSTKRREVYYNCNLAMLLIKKTILTGVLSLCAVISALRIGSPSSNQFTLAGGNDPQVSQRKGTDLPAINRSLADTIFIFIGFTATIQQCDRQSLIDDWSYCV